MATSASIIYPSAVSASELSSQAELPDEAFLEFLASMAETDGEVTDPLDMLDLDDEPMLDAGPVLDVKSIETNGQENSKQEDFDQSETQLENDLNTSVAFEESNR